MPGLPYVIQETHQSTTRNKHTRATVSSENLKNSNLVRKVSWDLQCHTDYRVFERLYGITQSAFPQSKIRLRPKFWYRRRNTKREDNTICSQVVFYKKKNDLLSITQNRKKNRAGIKNSATQHEHIPSSKMLNEVNTTKNPPESEKLEC